MLTVAYTPIAEKYFKKLKEKNLKKAFKEAIINIRKNPDIGEAKTGDLRGIYSLDIQSSLIAFSWDGKRRFPAPSKNNIYPI